MMFWLTATQNGWPSVTSSGVEPNSQSAVADVANEKVSCNRSICRHPMRDQHLFFFKAYYELLDSKCSYFKDAPNGGIGWFAHIYSENQEPGYGIYGTDDKLKIPFNPRYSCDWRLAVVFDVMLGYCVVYKCHRFGSKSEVTRLVITVIKPLESNYYGTCTINEGPQRYPTTDSSFPLRSTPKGSYVCFQICKIQSIRHRDRRFISKRKGAVQA